MVERTARIGKRIDENGQYTLMICTKKREYYKNVFFYEESLLLARWRSRGGAWPECVMEDIEGTKMKVKEVVLGSMGFGGYGHWWDILKGIMMTYNVDTGNSEGELRQRVSGPVLLFHRPWKTLKNLVFEVGNYLQRSIAVDGQRKGTKDNRLTHKA